MAHQLTLWQRWSKRFERSHQIKWGTSENNLPLSWENVGVRDHLSFSMYYWRSPGIKSHEGDEEEREERRKMRR